MKVSATIGCMRIVAALCCIVVLVGCETTTERKFGDAVRATLAQQRVEPSPPPAEPPGTDGQRIENVMTAHRAFVGDPVQVSPELQVDKQQGSQ